MGYHMSGSKISYFYHKNFCQLPFLSIKHEAGSVFHDQPTVHTSLRYQNSAINYYKEEMFIFVLFLTIEYLLLVLQLVYM